MAQKRDWEIKNVAGEVIHLVRSVTKKEAVEALIKRGASFRNADLRDADLSHMRLDNLDFSGADLSGARLRGSTANKTKFDGCLMNGVRAEGMTARQASFRDIVAGRHRVRGTDTIAVFDGAQLTWSSFDGARLNEASFEGCSVSGATFDLAKLKRCVFRNARLNNTDWSRSEVLQCDFAEAELNATTAAFRVPRASLPNRTVDAIAVGNKYKGTIIDETTPSFKWDRRFGTIDRHLAWGVSSAAMIAAATLLPIDVGDKWLGKLVGQGTALIGALALLQLLKDKIGGVLQEKLGDVTLSAQLALRTATIELMQRGANIRQTIAALGRGPGFSAIRRALSATTQDADDAGIMPLVKSLVAGDTNIILCDRRHMALALEWLSSSFDRTKLLGRDFVISRIDHEDDAAPSILKFFAGGGMAAFWTKGNAIDRAMHWEADNMVPEQWPVNGAPRSGPMQAMHARQLFETAVIRDHLPNGNLTYDRLTQQLRAGRDGSVVVTMMRDQLPRNPHGPVVIRPTGEQMNEQQAKDMQRRENRDDAADLPAPGL